MQKREHMGCAPITFLKQKTGGPRPSPTPRILYHRRGGYQPPVIFFAKIEGKRKKQPYWVASFLARFDKKDANLKRVKSLVLQGISRFLAIIFQPFGWLVA